MSPSWHERIHAVLMPDRVSVWRIPRGLRARPGVPEHIELAIDDTGTTQVGLLAACLDRWKMSNTRIHVALAGEFVRFAVLPAGKLSGETQRQALVRIVFRRIYGAASDAWTLCVSAGGPNEALLACGIDTTLFDALKVACASHGRLASLRPVWMDAVNRYRQDIGRGSGCLALVEPGRLTLGALEGGRWREVVGRRLPGQAQNTHAILAEHLALAAPASPATLWLCDLTGAVRGEFPALWTIQRLPLPAGVTHAGEAVAAWGVI